MIGRRSQVLAFLANMLLAVVMTWPLALHADTRLGGGLDPLLQSWILAWDAHALRTNPLAIWQAPIFFPYPDTLAYTDHHLPQMLVAAPIIWATGNPALAHNLLILLSYALSGWAVALLALDFITDPERPVGFSDQLSAFVVGAAFAFCGFRMAQFVHLQMLQTAWLPLALLFLRRTLRNGTWRDGLLCGLFFAIQCVTALYFSYFAALTLGLYAGLWLIVMLWRTLRQGAPIVWWPGVGLMAGGLLAALIVVPLTLPYVRVYQSLGIVRSIRELDNWSAPLQSYLAVDPGNRLLGMLGPFQASGGEFALFPGAVVSLLALVGVQHSLQSGSLRRLDTIFLIVLALIAFTLSLGTTLRLVRGDDPLPLPLPYGVLYERLPGFAALRVPARWGMLVALAICLLAGPGLAALAHWFARLQRSAFASRIGSGLPLLALALILAESSTNLPLTTAPDLRAAPAVYTWLGQPAQSDLRSVLELPAGRTQRGAELEKTMRRQYFGAVHWHPLATGYSGLIPFGTTDLLGRAQSLPNEDALRFLQLAGIDTLILHRDEYPPDQIAKLASGLDSTPLVQKRAEIGEALVYTLRPFEGLDLPHGASVVLTGDERVSGLPALALVQRWSASGLHLYGPGRVRYYGPLASPQPGQIFDYGLLADREDPRSYGFTAAGLQWRVAGLALYVRDPALRASLDLGVVPAQQFHPASPAALDLTVEALRVRIAGRELSWGTPIAAPVVEIDLASLVSQELIIDTRAVAIQPGATTLSIPVSVGQPLRITGRDGQVAMLRVRIRDGPAATMPEQGGLAVAATSQFDQSRLTINIQAGGEGALLVEARGAAALDDRPILLFAGTQPVPAQGSGTWTLSVDLRNPSAPWIQNAQTTGQIQDGRYQVYLKDADHPDQPGRAIAKFSIRGGAVLDAEAVRLPLTVLR